ncbi:MAG TPA: dTDP-4-amino-4,6-dideoxygalactose transaminase [Gemmatimonadales bacterium]|nr:dTDP-4-amino-4,6-dideoxygalactose transaminase [Gemmatimonadales bacterium]
MAGPSQPPSEYPIPFSRPSLEGRELEYLSQAAQSGRMSGGGRFSRLAQDHLERLLSVPRALLTTSCSDALEMSTLLANVGPGDEVIVPSFTFVSVANAVVLRGATPIFADIRPDTLNIDEKLLPGLITPRTKAVIVVHYAGVGCEMDQILAICEKAGISVIEDAAHSMYAYYRGRPLGTLGRLGTYSFHETKNISCGEGGALLINDPELVDRAEIVHEKGTNRNRFFRGLVDKYTWVDLGSSHILGELGAAVLLGQLEAAETIQRLRRSVWERYDEGIAVWARDYGVQVPFVPDHCEQSFHIYYLVLPSLDARQGLLAHLKARGIAGAFHYQALHTSEMGERLGGRPGQCPVTERVSDQLLRLPLYNRLTDSDVEQVIDAVTSFNPEARDHSSAGLIPSRSGGT